MNDFTDPSFWEQELASEPTVDMTSPDFWKKELKKTDLTLKKDDKRINIQNPKKTTNTNAIMKANLVRDPNTKIEIFANARGIPASKYKIINDEIVFEGEDGNTYREERSGFLSGLRRFGIETATDPATLGAAAGVAAATGVGLPAAGAMGATAAMLGAGIGESGRQLVADQVYDEQRPMTKNVQDIGLTAAITGAGEALAPGMSRAIKKITPNWIHKKRNWSEPTKKAAKVLEKTGFLEPGVIEHIGDMQALAKKSGIKLNMLEAAADTPVTMGVPKTFELESIAKQSPENAIIRSQEIKENIPGFLKTIFPESEVKDLAKVNLKSTGFDARKIIQKKLKGLDIKRRNITRPLYKKAYADNPIIDTSNLIEYIDQIKEKSIKSKASVLNPLKNDLVETKIVDKLGKETKETVSEIPLEKLDDFKKMLDHKINISKTVPTSYEKSIQVELIKIRQFLLNKIDGEYPEYKLARATDSILREGSSRKKAYEQALAQVKTTPWKYIENKAEKLSNLGNFNKTTKENLENIVNINDDELRSIGGYILHSNKTTPNIVRQTRNVISATKDGKKTWQNIVSDYIRTEASQIPFKAGKTTDWGYQLWEKTMGTESKQKVFKAALTKDQYKAFYNYMNILRRTGLVFKGKPTAKQVKIEPPKGLKKAIQILRPLTNSEYIIGQELLTKINNNDIESLTKIMFDENVVKKLIKINPKANKDKVFTNFIRVMNWGVGRETQK